MILRHLVVSGFGTNCYIFGSSNTKEVVIIDPGAEPKRITNLIEQLELKPIAVLITHGHGDHSSKLGVISSFYDIPLMYSKKEYDSGIYRQMEANRWLVEGDIIEVGELTLHVLETPGHSPDSISFYCKDVKEFEGQKIDGIIFTGDLIFRRSIGRSDLRGGNSDELFASIKNKVMYNPEITDNFLILSGHMGITSVGEERKMNMFKNYFL